MALAEYNDIFWFPSGELARNIPARIFPEHSNTLAALYADADGVTPLPNPLNTDNDGRLRFWAEAGMYWISIDTETFRVGVGSSDVGVTPGQLEDAIAQHAADHTDVHGIAETLDLETRAGAQARVDAHAALTAGVHGIADTAALETQAGAQAKATAAQNAAEAAASTDATAKVNQARAVLEEEITATGQQAASELAAHAAQTVNVHGIPDTSTIPTNEQMLQTQQELDAHEAATTNVHGIPDTAAIPTTAQIDTVASNLAEHVADTMGVHGIADTSQLLTQVDLDQYATDAELAAHAAQTANVHGIADTAALVTQAQLDGLATDADVAQVQTNLDTHAAATTGVHGITDTAALLTAADLTGYVQHTEFDAHTAATTNVHGIPDTSQLLTQAVLDGYVTDAELSAHTTATTDVHGIPDTAALATTGDLAGLATQAALDAHEAATTNVHGITDTAALATTEDLAGYTQNAAFDAHVAATTGVHGISDTSTLETKAGAQAKADAARDQAILTVKGDPFVYVPTGWGQFWRAARDQAATAQARIVTLGGSATQGFFASNPVTKSWPGLVRAALQPEYGDGGQGFVASSLSPAVLASGDPAALAAWQAVGAAVEQTGTWSYSSNRYGPGITGIYTDVTGNSATFHARGSIIRIFTISGGTRPPFTYSIDGGAPVEVAVPAGAAAVQETVITGLANTDHTVTLTCGTTTTGQYLTIAGVSGENPTGVVVHNVARAGAGSASYADHLPAQLNAVWNGGISFPGHCVIYTAGPNDAAANVTGDVWAANIAKYLKAVRDTGTATGATDLVFALPHLGRHDTTNFKYQDYAERARGLADTYGAAFINWWGMGRNSWQYWSDQGYWGTNANPGAVGNDSVHMSDAGFAFMAQPVIDLLKS